jgi:hypothetical protein
MHGLVRKTTLTSLAFNEAPGRGQKAAEKKETGKRQRVNLKKYDKGSIRNKK